MRRVNLIPIAGAGIRFKNKGYKTLKPLIPIDGKPMFVWAVKSLPKSDVLIFVCLRKHIINFKLNKIIKKYFPKSKILILKRKTRGQADTCFRAKKLLKKNDLLTIGSCDYKMEYNKALFKKVLKTSDFIVWTFKDKISVKNNPNAYGYVKANKKNLIINSSCKKVLSSKPWNDHVIIGTFTFKNANIFLDMAEKLFSNKITINNEFYLDSLINIIIKYNYKNKIFLTKKYIGWGTPLELKNYKKK